MKDEDEGHIPEDLFGQSINLGDFVVGAQSKILSVYKVIRITPKMVRVMNIKAKTHSQKKGTLRYSNELLKIDEKLVTFFLMKQK